MALVVIGGCWTVKPKSSQPVSPLRWWSHRAAGAAPGIAAHDYRVNRLCLGPDRAGPHRPPLRRGPGRPAGHAPAQRAWTRPGQGRCLCRAMGPRRAARRAGRDRFAGAASRPASRRGVHRHAACQPRGPGAPVLAGRQTRAVRKAAGAHAGAGPGTGGAGANAAGLSDGSAVDAPLARLRWRAPLAGQRGHWPGARHPVQLLLCGALRPRQPLVRPGVGRRRVAGHRHLQPGPHALGAGNRARPVP
jgi:hypothetical protein